MSDVVASDGAPANRYELELGPRRRNAFESIENIGDVIEVAGHDRSADTCSPVKFAMIGLCDRYRKFTVHLGDHRPDNGTFLFE